MNNYTSELNELNGKIVSLKEAEFSTEQHLEFIREDLERLTNYRYQLIKELLNYIKSEGG